MTAEDTFEETQRQLAYVNGQIDTLKMFQASASTKANEYRARPRNKVAVSYNLMAMLTGTGRQRRNEDVQPSLEPVKYHSGSISIEENKVRNEKVRKSYELFRWLTE